MQSGGDGVMLEVGEFDPPWLRSSEKAMCVITLDTQKGHGGGHWRDAAMTVHPGWLAPTEATERAQNLL